jgi:uncharacterized protein (DUF433 family)
MLPGLYDILGKVASRSKRLFENDPVQRKDAEPQRKSKRKLAGNLLRFLCLSAPLRQSVGIFKRTLDSEWSIMVEIAPRIVVDPAVRFGKPVIQGTRVPVATIVAKLAGGMRAEEIVVEYGVSIEDVQAALHYAAQLLASEEILVAA